MDTENLFIQFFIVEGIALMYFCVYWLLVDKKIKSLIGYVAFSLVIGFCAFIVTLLISSQYEITLLFNAIITIGYSIFMSKSKLKDSFISND